MGYYINGADKKRTMLVKEYGAIETTISEAHDIVVDKDSTLAVVVLVDNGLFDAAGYAFDEREFILFTALDDIRPKTCFKMDKELVRKLTNCKQ